MRCGVNSRRTATIARGRSQVEDAASAKAQAAEAVAASADLKKAILAKEREIEQARSSTAQVEAKLRKQQHELGQHMRRVRDFTASEKRLKQQGKLLQVQRPQS